MLRRQLQSLDDGMFRRDLLDGRLSATAINDAIIELNQRRGTAQTLAKYFLGQNPPIFDRRNKEKEKEQNKNKSSIPDNRIAIPYARKLVNTVVGYMFAPALIQYSTENEEYKELLDEIFFFNGEKSKTSRLGKLASIFGVSYEIHYTENPDGSNPYPRFAPVPPEDILPVYSNDVEPELVAAVHRFTESDGQSVVEHIDIYYEDIIQSYVAPKTIQSFGDVSLEQEVEHGYGMVPIAVFRNNDEIAGDYEHILKLLDAYDVLMSDSMNEFDRFSHAYLIIKNLSMSEDQLEDVKIKRVIEVLENGGVEFLTKDIQHGFIEYMKEWIVEEIHKSTHIPDFTDENFAGGNQSGIAIRYKLTDLENIAAVKEIGFREGLYRRIQLLNSFLRTRGFNPVGLNEVSFTFNRNIPANLGEEAQIISNLRGHVSHKTILDKVASFVENSSEEMERLKEEADLYADIEEDMETLEETEDE